MRRALLLLIGLGLVGAAALLLGSRRANQASIARASDDMPEKKRPSGLVIRLSEATEPVEAGAAAPLHTPADIQPLSDAETQRVLARLPALVAAAEDELDFALREKSLPAPRPGRTIGEKFPPDAPSPTSSPSSTPSGPLKVERFSPDGPVPIAPQISVTFSQPMVAVTSIAELKKADIPLVVDPTPEGRWRWVGTKTLFFEASGARLPMATTYHARVPAGTRSAIGGKLDTELTFEFTTPPPTVLDKHPVDGPHPLDPLFFIAFDQRIDPAAVLAMTRLRATLFKLKLRLATPEEIEADELVRARSKAAGDGRWLAFKCEERLPSGKSFTLTVGAGTPSAEGPNKTAQEQSWTFSTYGPMKVVESRCGWSDTCPPLTPWRITFSNPIDETRFDKSMVTVSPDVPGFRVEASGSTLTLFGRTAGRTTYKVTLDAAIPDIFGQTLGRQEVLTFKVDSAPPALRAQSGPLVILDPSAPPRFPIYSINHPTLAVKIFSVEPAQWNEYQSFLREERRTRKGNVPPGRLVVDTKQEIGGAPDELVETQIDLEPALSNGLGHAIIVVEPTKKLEQTWMNQPIRVWVQSTKLAVDAFVDATELLAVVTSLSDGRPVQDAAVELLPSSLSATTDRGGLARIELSSSPGNLLIARRGSDCAILPETTRSWWRQEGDWKRRDVKDSVSWLVFDDRKMYRPGEEVRIKGWVRRYAEGKGGDISLLDTPQNALTFTLSDSRGNKVTEGVAQLNPLGGFDFALSLPKTMNLGSARVELKLQRVPSGVESGSHTHEFDVQEFRRPEYEVKTVVSEGPHFVGSHATATVTAAYYAGGPLPGADVTWNVTTSEAHFTPPNRGDYTFGTWVPWWEAGDGDDGDERTAELSAKTDAGGEHRLRIEFESVHPPRPSSVRAEATVMDVNRQAWTSGADMLVHPADLYVGLRGERMFVRQGEPLKIDTIVCDIDGKLVSGTRIRMLAERLEWTRAGGEWKEVAVDPQGCEIASGDTPGRCTFQTKQGGVYRVTADIVDRQGRANQTQMRIWVTGGKMPPKRNVELEKVTIVPDKKEYRAGETAELLLMAPFAPSHAVVTYRRSGLVKSEEIQIAEASYVLKVPIEEAMTPNLVVQVDLTGAAARTTDSGDPDPRLPKRPAYATGSITLKIPPLARTLALSVRPRDEKIEPGGSTVVEAEVRDAGGAPVAGAEIAVIVVDEAVLALTGYKLPDPIAVFYAERPAAVRDHYARELVLLAKPEEIALAAEGAPEGARMAEGLLPPPAPMMMKAAAPMAEEAADGGGGAPGPQIKMRSDFNPLALFAASLPTDASGRAGVDVKLPDNLTRYRIMAIAVAGGKQFGSGESAITARLPLMVRASPPRFLNFGDELELSVVLQNQTDGALTTDVAIRAANVKLTAGAGRRLTIPANDRVEVRFPARTISAGTARFQIGAVSGKWSDASELSLPVWTPATTEAFATYGQIDGGVVAQPVAAPEGVVREFGGLEVTTSSTQLQALTDAVVYLVKYPFECSEQLASRVLGIAALRDVLNAFAAEGLPAKAELEAAVNRDIQRLRALQSSDGGFSFWRRDDRPWPYVGIHAAHALVRAREKGFEVPKEMLDRSQKYLRAIEKHIPADYPEEVRRTLIAYALYVRSLMGDNDAAKARQLVRAAGLDGLQMEAIGWVLSVMSKDADSRAEVEQIRRYIANRVVETAGAASFRCAYSDGAYLVLHSNRRVDGVLLDALIADQPASDLIPKVVAGLLAHRKAGHWGNTQENVFILLALDRYFNTYEKVTPDFVARVWLGDRYAGEHEYRGRQTDRHRIDVPMAVLGPPGSKQNLIIEQSGAGRLYYRIGMQYAPSDLKLPPEDQGFTVERTYEAVDSPDDVKRGNDGVWTIRAGARVRVKLTLVAPSRRYHVALVDPLPAGLEPLNPALAVTGTLPESDDHDVTVAGGPGLGGPFGKWWWWRRPWFEHQNMRDERVEAFSSLLWEGVYTYTYYARATTPGRFVVPPPKAEEMYAPETFGRGAGDVVVVR